MIKDTTSLGIFQGDIVIRTALVAAINDLRANPWALDYVFSSLNADEMTRNTYGQKEMDQAKQWFLNNEIPVIHNLRIDNVRLPCISVSLQESNEVENLLADRNYDVEENYTEFLPTLFGPFIAESYDTETGILVIPATVYNTIAPNVGMVIEDSSGCKVSILEAEGNSVTVETGRLLKTGKLWLKSRHPQRVQLEAANFSESYVIGCHAKGEPFECMYLHSIVLFALMRYRQQYLEARGFGRSSVSSTDIRINDAFDAELVYSRFITLRGYVRNFWPKQIVSAIENVVSSGKGQTLGEYEEGESWGWGASSPTGISIGQSFPVESTEDGEQLIVPGAYIKRDA
jgi:hypothetical protein